MLRAFRREATSCREHAMPNGTVKSFTRAPWFGRNAAVNLEAL